MIHFDERRHRHLTTRWSADEEPPPVFRNKTKKRGGKKKNQQKTETETPAPKTIRLDVIPQYKSGLYKNVYWMHPNMAITRESREKEEFVGEVAFYQGLNTNVIVNFFTGLDYSEHAKLRFSHTAHTPPVIVRAASSTSSASSSTSYSKPTTDYLQKNMDTLVKKLDLLAFKQAILESRPNE
ncbi:unnamed protein product [Caenorhabditis nigoni]